MKKPRLTPKRLNEAFVIYYIEEGGWHDRCEITKLPDDIKFTIKHGYEVRNTGDSWLKVKDVFNHAVLSAVLPSLQDNSKAFINDSCADDYREFLSCREMIKSVLTESDNWYMAKWTGYVDEDGAPIDDRCSCGEYDDVEFYAQFYAFVKIN